MYFYRDVAMVYDQEDCQTYSFGYTPTVFNGPMFGGVTVAWILTSLGLITGPKSLGFVNIVTVIMPFILLIVLMIRFIMLNDEAGGKGMANYMSNESIVLKTNQLYDPNENFDDIIMDAY